MVETEAQIKTRLNITALAESDKKLIALVYAQAIRIDEQDVQIVQLRQELDAMRQQLVSLNGGLRGLGSTAGG